MKNDRHGKNKTEATNTEPAPSSAKPTAHALTQQLKRIAIETSSAIDYANDLTDHELHDRNVVNHLVALANTNRTLIQEIQDTLSQHAQTIVQQREALDELATTYNTRHPVGTDPFAACRNLGDDPLRPAT